MGFGKIAFCNESSEKLTILAGKIDESVVEILTSDSGVLRYSDVSEDPLPPFVVDADTLGGLTKDQIVSEAVGDVDLTNVDAVTLEGSTKQEILTESDKIVSGYATFTVAGWSGSNPMTQTQNLSVAAATMAYEPEIRLVPANGSALTEAEIKGFNLLNPVGETGDGTLTLKTKGAEKPTVNLKVLFVGKKV